MFNQNYSACHYSNTTETKIGPGLKGIFKMRKWRVSGHLIAEANLRQRIRTPYEIMPAAPELAAEKVDALIAFLKTL